MSDAERAVYDKVQYELRVERRLCGRCSCKLPDLWSKRTCRECLDDIREITRVNYWRKRGITPPPPIMRSGPKSVAAHEQQAPRKHIPAPYYECTPIAKEKRGRTEVRCPRCSLLEPHMCVVGDATARRAGE